MMQIVSGLLDGQVLQRNGRGFSDAAFEGVCAADGALWARVRGNGRAPRALRRDLAAPGLPYVLVQLGRYAGQDFQLPHWNASRTNSVGCPSGWPAWPSCLPSISRSRTPFTSAVAVSRFWVAAWRKRRRC